MSRRLDPEQLPPVCWPQVWRSLKAGSRCKKVGHWLRCDEWDVDTGYCLDRFSTRAEYADSERAAEQAEVKS